MRLTIIIPVLNQFEILQKTVELAVGNLTSKKTNLLFIDNGSDYPVSSLPIGAIPGGSLSKVSTWQNERNIGNYPIFKQGLELVGNEWENVKGCPDPVFNNGQEMAEGGILAFIHSDLFIYEKGWDRRVIEAFEQNEKLGLIGFIGSDEIDNWGGRGLGTVSNFQGLKVDKWQGSPAEVHGKRITGLKFGALVDGCSMIFRRECLEDIGFVEDFPPHHFYDRLMCCQALEKGWQVGILGIACDHISGQTVCHEDKYYETAKDWAIKNLGIGTPQDWANKNQDWLKNPNNPSFEKVPQNWDQVIYREAEKRFLQEWRDNKHLIPKKV